MIGLAAAVALSAVVAPSSTCELHLFALDLGAGPPPKGNFLVKPLPSSGDPLALINVMSPQDRMMDLSDDDYRRILNLTAETPVVRHWETPVGPSVKKATGPLVPTPGKCHLELVGYSSEGMQADRSMTGKDEVFISFALREFAADGSLGLNVAKGGYGQVDTVKKVGRDAALASLRKASVDIVENFGERSAKQRGKPAKNGTR